MNYKIARKLPPAQFKRRFGLSHETFQLILKALKPFWRTPSTPGAKPKLPLVDWILICLEYWREYRTYFHIGSSWGVSEATVWRIVRWVEDH
ncbi:MAG: transposase family protein [Alkalinema sp. RU_4_3]|nr:transposase family protein [Alkalinema sp. RU_4_3]